MKVLVVDTSPEVGKRFAEIILETAGIEVAAAVPGTQGFDERLLEFRPDVVVVDVQMPEAAGLDLIRKLKGSSRSPVVIAVSSLSTLPYRIRCHEAGAAFFFDKVKDQEKLVEAIAAVSRELEG